MGIDRLLRVARRALALTIVGTSAHAQQLPSIPFAASGWDFMLQGIAFGGYDTQSGPRGGSELGSVNWGMLMAQHDLAGGQLQLRAMLSLDPLGVPGRGYPLLLQTGETYRGDPLHDRQHPHDAFMELGARYQHALAGPLSLSVYAAPSGEPALGPVAFPMRASAMDDPLAPIGHHWQDATHVSFGVLTAGVLTHDLKLEGSLFNGREPNENRWDLDPIHLDSYAGRMTYTPVAEWSMAASYGYMKSPDATAPSQSMHRVTASLMHATPLGADGQWATSVVWGANAMSGVQGLSHSALAESEVVLDARNSVFGRVEYVQKTANDLVLTAPQFAFAPDRVFDVSALSLGYVREIARWSQATFGLGAVGIVNLVPSALHDAYGSRTPLGAMVFVRVRPFPVHGHSMDGMPMDGPDRVRP
jgi:hypothetical protein